MFPIERKERKGKNETHSTCFTGCIRKLVGSKKGTLKLQLDQCCGESERCHSTIHGVTSRGKTGEWESAQTGSVYIIQGRFLSGKMYSQGISQFWSASEKNITFVSKRGHLSFLKQIHCMCVLYIYGIKHIHAIVFHKDAFMAAYIVSGTHPQCVPSIPFATCYPSY